MWQTFAALQVEIFQRIILAVISAMYLDNFREDRDNSLSGVCRRFFRRRQCPRSEEQLERRERVGVRRSSSYIKSWRGHYPKSVLRWTLSQETLSRRFFIDHSIEQYHLLYFFFVKTSWWRVFILHCFCSSVHFNNLDVCDWPNFFLNIKLCMTALFK